MRLLLAMFLFTNAAYAGCMPDEELFMFCSFANGKAVRVCMDDSLVRYSFGPEGSEPELALTRAFGDGAEAVPWPGVGREIWEAVRLTNNDVIYEVYGGFDRLTAAEQETATMFGGIIIEDLDGSVIAHLRCLPETVDYAF